MAIIRKKVRIGDLMISEGLITAAQLETALKEQKIRGAKLGETLIALITYPPPPYGVIILGRTAVDNPCVFITAKRTFHIQFPSRLYIEHPLQIPY